MKKLLSIALVAAIATLVSCGPSAEEKAKMEQAKQDSIAAVQKTHDDSVAAANAAAEKAKQDSVNMAMEKAKQDSMEAANKKKAMKPASKTNKQKMEEDKKILKKHKG